MKKVTVQQFEAEVKNRPDVQCLDVREPSEHAQIRLGTFVLKPLSSLARSTADLDRSKATYLLCRTGNRACRAAESLEKMGFLDVRVIEGGLSAFEASGAPLIRGSSRVWNLERQVRFAAGSLVLTGIVLAWTVHPAAIGLSLFVASGLIFSAVTDTCGMAMLLARMPWNQK